MSFVKKIKELAAAWGALRTIVGAVIVLIVAASALRGAFDFLKEAPAIVNANAREMRSHHDSIADLFETTQAQAVFSDHIEEHLEAADSANASRDRQLSYLVCLRTERRRELDSMPALRDCDAELLTGEGNP